jgi:branched-chain amino acid transport system permease protein
MSYLLHLVVYFNIYLMVALSLNLIVGYCGLLTLAHAGFYAVGGYVYALLAMQAGWSFVPAALAGMAVAAILSLCVSLPSWRLRGDFFVLASLAVQALVYAAIYNWSSPTAPLGSWRNLTNGPFGIPGIPRPSMLGFQLSSAGSYALFASVVGVICAIAVWRLQRSPWGRLLIAMREDELALRGLGKNTRLLKVQAFAISAAVVSLAGCLYAGYVQYLDPSSASIDESILMLSQVIVGGVGNFRGPVIGALTLIALPELLRLFAFPDAQAGMLRALVYGLLLIVLMHVRPQGLAGEYRLR